MGEQAVRFALIGTGNVADTYAQAFNNADKAELVAVVNHHVEKAEQFAKAHKVSTWAGDIETMLKKTDIDAVAVITPSGLHADLTIEAARYRKHVLCEKPLDIKVDKIDAMIEACEKARVKLGCSFQHRTSAHNQAAFEAIQSGKLGKIYIANAFLKNYRPQEYYESAHWRGTWALDGGGPFMQQGAHTVDLMVWMMGRAKRVFAVTKTVAHEIEVEDMGHAIVEYENGAQGIIEASTVVKPGYANRIEIHGENGSIVLDESKFIDWSVEGAREPEMPTTAGTTGAQDPRAIGAVGHTKLIENFASAIIQDQQPLIPPQSARLSTELILAIYDSARTGKVITL